MVTGHCAVFSDAVYRRRPRNKTQSPVICHGLLDHRAVKCRIDFRRTLIYFSQFLTLTTVFWAKRVIYNRYLLQTAIDLRINYSFRIYEAHRVNLSTFYVHMKNIIKFKVFVGYYSMLSVQIQVGAP